MSWVFENFEVIRRLAEDAVVFEFGLRGRVEGGVEKRDTVHLENKSGVVYVHHGDCDGKRAGMTRNTGPPRSTEGKTRA